MAGHPHHLFCHGVKGSGKTHLLKHVAHNARQRGFKIIGIDAGATDNALQAVADNFIEPRSNFGNGVGPNTLRAAIEHAAQIQPILLSIDNLDADRDTAKMVSFLVRHLRHTRTMVISTYRPDRLPVVIADQIRRHGDHWPEPFAIDLQLKPFGYPELSELIESRIATSPPQKLMLALHRQTAGLPGLCVNYLDDLRRADVGIASALQPGPNDPETLPTSTRRCLIETVLDNDYNQRQVATALAVCVTIRFDQTGLLATLTGIELPTVRGIIDQLIAARLVIERDGAYQHTYPIVDRALYAELEPAVRNDWHNRAAEWLTENLCAADTTELARLAHHLQRGINPNAATTIAAIREAAARSPFDDPITTALVTGRFTTATQLLDAALATRPSGTPDLLLERGWGQYWQGQLAAAQDDLDTARQNGAHNLVLRDALEAHLGIAHGASAHALDILERLETQLDTLTEPNRTNIWTALRIAAAYDHNPTDNDARYPAPRHNAVDNTADISIWRHACDAAALWRQGRLELALRSANLAVEYIPTDRVDLAATTAWATQIAVYTEIGDLDQAAAIQRALPTEVTDPAAFALDCAVARLWRERGDFDRCFELLDESIRRERRIGRTNTLSMTLTAYIDTATAAGEDTLAQLANDTLQSLPADDANIAVTMRRMLCQARVNHDLNAAQAARSHAERYGLALDAAIASGLIGEISGDVSHLQRAYGECVALGATTSQAAISTTIRSVGESADIPPSSPNALTPDERRVAELVATGISNRETAQRMHLSTKTIEAYLTKIYAKTNCRSRVELAVTIQRAQTHDGRTTPSETTPAETMPAAGPTDADEVDHPIGHVLFGRAEEHKRITELIGQARANGLPQPLVMVGNLRTGKSALLQHAAEQSKSQGFTCLLVDGNPVDSLASFTSVRLALAQLSANTEYDAINQLIDTAIEAIDGEPTTPQAKAVAVADKIGGVLEALALRAPVTLAIDDLHDLDHHSTTALIQAVHQLGKQRIFIAITTRDEPTLAPLAAHELSQLLAKRKVLPMTIEPPVDETHEARGAMAIRSDIERAGTDVTAVAAAVGIAGRVAITELDVITSITGISAQRAAAALQWLLSTQLITTDTDTYQVANPLIGRTLYATVGPATRRHWHSQIAHQMRGRGDEMVAELAHHLRNSETGRDTDTALRIAAAGDLLIDDDPRAAADWFHAALDRLDPSDPTVENIKLRLSDALIRASDFRKAAQIANSLVRSAQPGPTRDGATVAAIQSSLAIGDTKRAIELIDTATDYSGGEPLAIYRAQLSLTVSDIDGAQTFLDRARAQLGDDDPTIKCVAAHILASRGEFRSAKHLVTQVLSQVDSSFSSTAVSARLQVGVLAASEFDPALAMSSVESVDDGGKASPWCNTVRSMARLRQGELREAVAQAEAGLSQLDQQPGAPHSLFDNGGENSLITQLCTASLIVAQVELGDLAAAQKAVSIIDIADPEATMCAPPLEIAIARLLVIQDDLPTAAQRLTRTQAHVRQLGHIGWLARIYGQQIQVAKAAGNEATARSINARLQDLADDETAVAVTMAQLHANSLIHRNPNDAMRAHAHAVKHGLQLSAASALGFAGSLRDEVEQLLEAYAELGQLGAISRQRWVAKEIRRLGRRVPSHRNGIDNGSGHAAPLLTPVEYGIAVLVGQGLTNREIAVKTNLSPKTVEVYLSRIYRKTDCRTRVLLAVAVNQGRFNQPLVG